MAQTMIYPPDLLGDLTPMMEKVPYKPSLLTDMGIFKPKFTNSININIDVTETGLVVLPEGHWGHGGVEQTAPTAKMVQFRLEEIVLKDAMSPEDLQDRRRPGSTGPSTVSLKMAEKMANMKAKFDLTIEYMQMTALKGTLMGGSGRTLYNYYDKFGVSQEKKNFTLSDVSFDINGAIRGLKDYIIKNHNAPGVVTGYTVLCSSSFFDKLVEHPKVVRAYENYASPQEPLRNDVSASFVHQGVRFMVYDATAKLMDGSTATFIAADKAYAFPNGLDLFETWYGPEYSMAGVNTIGSQFYLRTKPMDYDQGIAMKGSTVPLPVCKRPEAVVELTAN